jgi:hypothetical protein
VRSYARADDPGTRAWIRSGEGSGRSGWRFTVKGDTLYAIALAWPGDRAVIRSLAPGSAQEGKVRRVRLLGHPGDLEFTQDAEGLKVKLPAQPPGQHAFALEIRGLTLNPPGPAVPADPPDASR